MVIKHLNELVCFFSGNQPIAVTTVPHQIVGGVSPMGKPVVTVLGTSAGKSTTCFSDQREHEKQISE